MMIMMMIMIMITLLIEHACIQIGKIRILSFLSFCLIDRQLYSDARSSLESAMQLNRQLIREKLTKIGVQMGKLELEEAVRDYFAALLDQSATQHPLSDLENDMLYLKRIEWILLYHCALCMYMQQSYFEAEMVGRCMLISLLARIISYCLNVDAVRVHSRVQPEVRPR